jgi:hypothetical protein
MKASRYQLLPRVTKGSLVTVRAVSLPLFIGNDTSTASVRQVHDQTKRKESSS